MRKKFSAAMAVLLLSVPFHAERHLVVNTYDGSPFSSAVSKTGYITLSSDSLSLTSTDGVVALQEALCNIRSLAVQDMEPTSVHFEEQSYGPADTASVQSDAAVKRLEDGQLYIYRGGRKYKTTGVQVQ